MAETHLQWLARRTAIAKARIETMTPITPQPTPLLELLQRQPEGRGNGKAH